MYISYAIRYKEKLYNINIYTISFAPDGDEIVRLLYCRVSLIQRPSYSLKCIKLVPFMYFTVGSLRYNSRLNALKCIKLVHFMYFTVGSLWYNRRLNALKCIKLVHCIYSSAPVFGQAFMIYTPKCIGMLSLPCAVYKACANAYILST